MGSICTECEGRVEESVAGDGHRSVIFLGKAERRGTGFVVLKIIWHEKSVDQGHQYPAEKAWGADAIGVSDRLAAPRHIAGRVLISAALSFVVIQKGFQRDLIADVADPGHSFMGAVDRRRLLHCGSFSCSRTSQNPSCRSG